jgi:hypothetical protein
MLARTHAHRVLAFAPEVTGVSVVGQWFGSEAGARSPAFMHAAMRAMSALRRFLQGREPGQHRLVVPPNQAAQSVSPSYPVCIAVRIGLR